MARDIGLAILSGLLGGFGRIGPAIQHARDVEMAERKQRVSEQQLEEQRRFHTESLAQQRVPADVLRAYGADIPATTPFVPTALASELIRIGQSRTRGREAAALIRGGPTDQPGQRLVADLLESGLVGQGDVAPLLNLLFPKRDPFTLGPGQQRFDPSGSVVATGPPMEPKKPTEGEERRAIIDQVLRDKGYHPGTPEYNEQFLNALRTYPVPEGGQLFGGGQLIPPARPATPSAVAPPSAAPSAVVPGRPGGPPPLAAGPPRPLESAAAQLLSGAAQAREAAQAALAALEDPVTRNYVGPYAQYLSEAQRRAPYQALGEIPPAVISLEQNLARVKNHTIKLITGAQMSEHEARRIQAELPQMGNQPQEFRQRLQRTLENITMMEGIIQGLLQRPGRETPRPATPPPPVETPQPHVPTPTVPQTRPKSPRPPSKPPKPESPQKPPKPTGVIRYERDPVTGRLRPIP